MKRYVGSGTRFKILIRPFYDEGELKEWVPTVHQLAEEADRAHVLFNHCYQGHAARNALQMAELLAAGN